MAPQFFTHVLADKEIFKVDILILLKTNEEQKQNYTALIPDINGF